MLIVLTVSALVIGLSGAFIWYLSAAAPEGYEDRSGFHVTAKSAIALKSEEKAASAVLDTHNDHEPIAA